MPAKFEGNAGGPQRGRRIHLVAQVGERHDRAPPGEQVRGRDSASGGAHHHNPPIPDRKSVCTHVLTAASTLSG
jgi:hypothetical protein